MSDDGPVTVVSLREVYDRLVTAGAAATFEALRVPEEAFARLFGADAEAIASTYAALLPLREQVLGALFQALAGASDDVDVQVFTVAEMREQELFLDRLRLFSFAEDARFGFVVGQLPLLFWVYEGGAWRYLGDVAVLAPEQPDARGLAERLMLLVELCTSAPAEGRYATTTLVLPEHRRWFADQLGDAAEGAIAEYDEYLASEGIDEVASIIVERILGARDMPRGDRIAVEGFLSPYQPGGASGALAAMRDPLPLYVATLAGAYQLFWFAFVGGHWRWLGKLRAVPEGVQRWQPAVEYGADEAGLQRFVLDCTHRAATGALDAQALAIPDAEAWLAARIGAEAAAALAPQQQVADQLAAIARGEHFVIEAKRIDDDAGALTTQRLWRSLVPGEEAYSVTHRGPDARALRTTWVRVDGAWRWLSVPSLAMVPAYRSYVKYPWPEDPSTARFPPTEEGLAMLCDELVRAARHDRGWLHHLLHVLIAPRPEPRWFAPFVVTEGDAVVVAAQLAERAADHRSSIAEAVSVRGRHRFRVIPTKGGAFLALWRFPSMDRHERYLGPAVFADGGWRLLEPQLGWTEAL